MAKYYNVIVYNDKTNKYDIDTEMTLIVFPKGNIELKGNTWEQPYIKVNGKYTKRKEIAGKVGRTLHLALDKINGSKCCEGRE